MNKTENTEITEIKFDKNNYRIHNDKNKSLIKKSLQKCGAGRSIVIDNEGEIIAGNGIYEQAQKLKIPTKIIETDETELIVVKRTDLATQDAKCKQLAVFDNSTSDSSENDLDKLEQDFSLDELAEFGIDVKLKNEEIEGEVPFTEELLEEHNYVVLYFDNKIDWLQAETLFGLKQVKALDSKEGFFKKGIGRVLNGSKALDNLRKEFGGGQ